MESLFEAVDDYKLNAAGRNITTELKMTFNRIFERYDNAHVAQIIAEQVSLCAEDARINRRRVERDRAEQRAVIQPRDVVLNWNPAPAQAAFLRNDAPNAWWNGPAVGPVIRPVAGVWQDENAPLPPQGEIPFDWDQANRELEAAVMGQVARPPVLQPDDAEDVVFNEA